MTTRPGGFLRRVLVLARAEVLHVVRDRTSLIQILIMPLVQLLVLANAATFAIRNTPLYVVDFDRSSVSRGVVSRLLASGYFDLVGRSSAPEVAIAVSCCQSPPSPTTRQRFPK